MAATQVPTSGGDEELRIDTTQHTWCFDRIRRRFRRVPRGSDPNDPAIDPAWAHYWLLSREDGGALTVVLDREGTLRLRVVDERES
jgi:hypothetical protein